MPGSGYNICFADNYYAISNLDRGGFKQYATFSVAPPVKTVTVGNGFVCDAVSSDGLVTCTATIPGASQNAFNFAQTFGHFWWGYDDLGQHLGASNACIVPKQPLFGWTDASKAYTLFSQVVPAQSISCPITVVDRVGSPPNSPAISGDVCTAGSPRSLTVIATDPDADKILSLIHI